MRSEIGGEMKTNIHEYSEEMSVEIKRLSPENGEKYRDAINERSYKGYKESRYVIIAYNEGGYNCTQVDLLELLRFVKRKMPEIWEKI